MEYSLKISLFLYENCPLVAGHVVYESDIVFAATN